MRTGIGLYVTHSEEAVPLYMEAFGLTLGYHVKNPDGSFYHSELMKDDAEMFSVVESAKAESGHTVQVNMLLDDADAVKRAFDLLSVDGAVEMPIRPLPWSPCATVILDRFGVWWYITAPQHQPGDDFDPSFDWEKDESGEERHA